MPNLADVPHFSLIAEEVDTARQNTLFCHLVRESKV